MTENASVCYHGYPFLECGADRCKATGARIASLEREVIAAVARADECAHNVVVMRQLRAEVARLREALDAARSAIHDECPPRHLAACIEASKALDHKSEEGRNQLCDKCGYQVGPQHKYVCGRLGV